ncbi:GTPase HflX [Treponema sp.]|uniref:GTPase HflX n=1 Tax=Treponema sp. TaxID=166 RepID=UPI00298EB756|nr:GTPase HflX [Treponema sp.]MCR5613108.1 GTPase HflX [Treponema sp.]
MYEVREEQERKTRCMLIGQPGDSLTELKGLLYTLGMEVADAVVLNKIDIQPAYGMGSGKAEELCAHAKAVDADCIIMDYELDPTKQRNWEKLCSLPVFDRQEVILRIFASRALTREAVLQVELARLEYSLPRLSHMYGDLARQRGGNYGAKGSGEKQLELDRRGVRENIFKLKKELEKVVQDREVQRKRRQKSNIKTVALCGYTNAGKSSLLNALTSSEAFVEDKLFATLDPLTRKLFLKNPDYENPDSYSTNQIVSKGQEILITDTVGFISNLPHSLVNAFRSTLEEASYADLLLIVLDASDPEIFNHYATIVSVLEEIKADKNKSIIVLNKMDRFDNAHRKETCAGTECDHEGLENDDLRLTKIENEFPEHIKVSAKDGRGLEELKNRLWQALR